MLKDSKNPPNESEETAFASILSAVGLVSIGIAVSDFVLVWVKTPINVSYLGVLVLLGYLVLYGSVLTLIPKMLAWGIGLILGRVNPSVVVILGCLILSTPMLLLIPKVLPVGLPLLVLSFSQFLACALISYAALRKVSSVSTLPVFCLTAAAFLQIGQLSLGLEERVSSERLNLASILLSVGIVVSSIYSIGITQVFTIRWRVPRTVRAIGFALCFPYVLLVSELNGLYPSASQVVAAAGFLALAVIQIDQNKSRSLFTLLACWATLTSVCLLQFFTSPLDAHYKHLASSPVFRSVGTSWLGLSDSSFSFDKSVLPTPPIRPGPRSFDLAEGQTTYEKWKGNSILLVTVDTLRYDYTGYSGLAPPQITPNLDRLSKDSQRFHRAYVQGGWTSLSIPAIMKSRHPKRIDFIPLYEDDEFKLYVKGDVPADVALRKAFQTPLVDNHKSLSEFLRPHYQTIAVPNDGFTHYFDPRLGFSKGFEDVRYPREHVSPGRWTSNGVLEVDDSVAVELAIEELRTRSDERPFFVWLHLFSPHAPYKSHTSNQFSGYESEVNYVDAQIGRVLDVLDEEELAEKTIVAVLSDHGEGLGEGSMFHGLDLTEQSTRVPFLLRIPGLPGRDVYFPIATIDLAPTLLGLVGYETDPKMNGFQLFSMIENTEFVRPAPVFLETWRFRGFSSERDLHLVAAIDDSRKVVVDIVRNQVTFHRVGREIEDEAINILHLNEDELRGYLSLWSELLHWKEGDHEW